MMNMGDSNNGDNIVSRVVFKTISNVYDGAIFQNKLTITLFFVSGSLFLKIEPLQEKISNYY